MPLKVLLVAEGSGGHLVPALEVAQQLAARGASIRLWYAQRRQSASLTEALTRVAAHASVAVDSIPLETSSSWLQRVRQCGQLWRRTTDCLETFAPDVVVGFGGWVSAPVVLASRWRPRSRATCILHEQNVMMGRANRLLARWADRVAVSFDETRVKMDQRRAIVTGLPVRHAIGRWTKAAGATRLGLRTDQLTILVLGGSQGAQAINRLMMHVAPLLHAEERPRWQIVHLTGAADELSVRAAYAAAGITAWVGAFLPEIEAAYALADVVISRAGASTIAELAQCGLPAILIPYPHAGGHQRANARIVEHAGAGLLIDEAEAAPTAVLGCARRMLSDSRLRAIMGAQMRTLHQPDATERLSAVITALGASHGMATSFGDRNGRVTTGARHA